MRPFKMFVLRYMQCFVLLALGLSSTQLRSEEVVSKFLPEARAPLSEADAAIAARVEEKYAELKKIEKTIDGQSYWSDDALKKDVERFRADLDLLIAIVESFSDEACKSNANFKLNLELIRLSGKEKKGTFSTIKLLPLDEASKMMDRGDLNDQRLEEKAQSLMKDIISYSQFELTFHYDLVDSGVVKQQIWDDARSIAIRTRVAKEKLLAMEQIPALARYVKTMKGLYETKRNSFAYRRAFGLVQFNVVGAILFGEGNVLRADLSDVIEEAEVVATLNFAQSLAEDGHTTGMSMFIQAQHMLTLKLQEDPDRLYLAEKFFRGYLAFYDLPTAQRKLMHWERELKRLDPALFADVSAKKKKAELAWWYDRARSGESKLAWDMLAKGSNAADPDYIIAMVKLIRLRNLDRQMVGNSIENDSQTLLLWEEKLKTVSLEHWAEFQKDLPDFERLYLAKASAKYRPGAINLLAERANHGDILAARNIVALYKQDIRYMKRDMMMARDPNRFQPLVLEGALKKWEAYLALLEQKEIGAASIVEPAK